MSEVTGAGGQRPAGSGTVAMPRPRSRRSGRRPGAGTALADGRWWHRLCRPARARRGLRPVSRHGCGPRRNGRRAPRGCPARRRSGRHHLGRQAPADNDPLADVGGGEPDLEPVAHAGHLHLGAAVGLAMAPLPAGSIAGGVAGVIRQWSWRRRAIRAGRRTWRSRRRTGPIGWARRLGRRSPRPGRAARGRRSRRTRRVDAGHRFAFAGQPAGHWPARALSLAPMQGSVITHVTGGPISLGDLRSAPGGRARAGLVCWAGRRASRRCATSPPSVPPAGCRRSGGCAARSSGRPAGPRWS